MIKYSYLINIHIICGPFIVYSSMSCLYHCCSQYPHLILFSYASFVAQRAAEGPEYMGRVIRGGSSERDGIYG